VRKPAENIDTQTNMESDRNTLNRGPWRRQAAEVSLPEVHGSIPIPKTASFWRKMLAFSGPGALVAVGYMDPGNWATDLQGGAQFGYTLLSVIMISNLVAMFLRYLCVKLGVASGRDLAQACRDHYSKPTVWFLWILAEIAMVSTDLAEVIGSGIALQLCNFYRYAGRSDSNGRLSPLPYRPLVAQLDNSASCHRPRNLCNRPLWRTAGNRSIGAQSGGPKCPARFRRMAAPAFYRGESQDGRIRQLPVDADHRLDIDCRDHRSQREGGVRFSRAGLGSEGGLSRARASCTILTKWHSL
jgi:hypothetical protein